MQLNRDSLVFGLSSRSFHRFVRPCVAVVAVVGALGALVPSFLRSMNERWNEEPARTRTERTMLNCVAGAGQEQEPNKHYWINGGLLVVAHDQPT